MLIPSTAEIHIQKTAPVPPIAMAVATPAILPVPTWAATAVASAWKEFVWSQASSIFSFFLKIEPKLYFIARPKCRIWGTPR